jgi:2-(1,2-epoxy-1,2-dihydrophenyl)acetyl-CoA isomerase
VVGLSRALEIALLGDWVEADQALQFGLVNRVWPADEFERRAAETVAGLAAGPTLAFARTKTLFRDHLEVGLAEALAGEAKAQVASGQTSDHLEGVTAFLEKRPPSFQGA